MTTFLAGATIAVALKTSVQLLEKVQLRITYENYAQLDDSSVSRVLQLTGCIVFFNTDNCLSFGYFHRFFLQMLLAFSVVVQGRDNDQLSLQDFLAQVA